MQILSQCEQYACTVHVSSKCTSLIKEEKILIPLMPIAIHILIKLHVIKLAKDLQENCNNQATNQISFI